MPRSPGEVEMAFAKAGKFVLSNAKNFRMEPDVPLVIPEVNGDHLGLIDCQRRNRGWKGAIVTNANCSATVAAVALAPLHQKFGSDSSFCRRCRRCQARATPACPRSTSLGNVIPYIADEEPKLEREMLKLLGTYEDGEVTSASFKVSAHTNRVPVEHGHTICMSHRFRGETHAGAGASRRCARGRDSPRRRDCRRGRSIHWWSPMRRIARSRSAMFSAGDGMTVTVGRVRRDAILDLRMVALGHNTVRGAAGGSVLNAELLASTGALRLRVIVVKVRRHFGRRCGRDRARRRDRQRPARPTAGSRGVGAGRRDQLAARDWRAVGEGASDRRAARRRDAARPAFPAVREAARHVRRRVGSRGGDERYPSTSWRAWPRRCRCSVTRRRARFDAIAAFGEQLSSHLVAAFFKLRGIPAEHVDARDVFDHRRQFHVARSRRPTRSPKGRASWCSR